MEYVEKKFNKSRNQILDMIGEERITQLIEDIYSRAKYDFIVSESDVMNKLDLEPKEYQEYMPDKKFKEILEEKIIELW